VFGLSALPPQWLPIISALSQYCEVHFLVHNPCQYYWGDVLSETQQLKLERSLISKGVSPQTAASSFLEHNTLLASWGRLGRDYLSILVNQDDIKEMPVDLYECPDGQCALAYIQADILNLEANKHIVPAHDDSIRFASCHSHLREVEVLYDYLLRLLDQNPELSPKDIIVMMPDVQNFAALIDAVFSRRVSDAYGQKQYLPYGISDQMLALDQPIVDVLCGILNLSSLRISATEVLDWLDVEAIRERFKISEDDLEQVHSWVDLLNIRWGLSESHRDKHLSMSGSGSGNTWMSAFRRLLAGYVHGVDGVIFSQHTEVSAQSYSQQEIQVLAGKLMRFLDVIETTAELQQGRFSVDEWLTRLTHFWHVWFDSQLLSEDILRLMDQSLSSLHEQVKHAGFEGKVGFSVVAGVVSANFEKEQVSQRFLAGRINFCTLMPMRSIPFKMVCMLGMNEGQYPRPEQKQSFNLLSVSTPRVGDRSRREDDRYLFLEALCSARSYFYISYCGHDIKDNSERYPSVLVSELQDYCHKYFSLEDGQSDVLTHWTHKHRLQPFHLDYYSTTIIDPTCNNLPKSYNDEWLALFDSQVESDPSQGGTPDNTAQASAAIKEGETIADEQDQFDLFSKTEPEKVYDLAQLNKMANHPLRYYYQSVLGITYGGMGSELERSEPFSLSHIDQYKLKSDIAHAWHQHHYLDHVQDTSLDACNIEVTPTESAVFKQWLLSDKLPRQPVAKLYYDDSEQSLSDMKRYLRSLYHSDSRLSNIRIDLQFGSGRVQGDVLISEFGMIELGLGKAISSRFFGFWVKHIFWNVYHGRLVRDGEQTLCGDITSARSQFVTVDEIWGLPELGLARAERYAEQILTLFSETERRPTPFLAKSTFAALFEKETQVRSAFNGLNIGNGAIPGESEDPYWQRFCLFMQTSQEPSDGSDTGNPENMQFEVNKIPDLTQSIFYTQVFENIDDIQVEELSSKECHESP